MLKKQIGERIKLFRNLKEITQHQLAEKTDVSIKTIYNCESGRKISINIIEKISTALSIPVINFFDFELAEDVKEFVTENKDVVFQDLKLKEKLFSFDNSVLLKVTKTINSPTMIVEITQIDEEFIKENY